MGRIGQPQVTVIVAASATNGIGRSGTLPWRLKTDMAFFAGVTRAAADDSRNAVIMGRKTWDSIPARFRPLSGRTNIVISRQSGALEGEDAHRVGSLDAALEAARGANRIFLAGGAQLYRIAFDQGVVDRVVLTRIETPDYECDTFLPDFTLASGAFERAPEGALEAFATPRVLAAAGVPADGCIQEGDTRYKIEVWERTKI